MIKKFLAIFSMSIPQFFLYEAWGGCNRFGDQFHFSYFDLTLRLQEGIHNDTDIPIFLVRLFHNKAAGTLLDIFRETIRFWDISFLISLLSFVGLFGYAYGIFKLYERKKMLFLISAIFIFTFQLLEILGFLRFAFEIKILFLLFYFDSIALYGLSQFLKKNFIRITIPLILLALSLWWIYVFPFNPLNFCLK